MKKTLLVFGLAAILSGMNVTAAGIETAADEDHECTSWLVMPDLTGGKKLLLHKNRDSKARNICLRWGTGTEGREWIAVADYKAGVNMGLNSKGVAVVMNSGDPCDGVSDYKGHTTPVIAQIIVAQCSTAAEGVKCVENIFREKKYSHGKYGSIWFISDIRESYVIEQDALRFAVHPVKSGFAIRANAWHYPEMVMYSQRTPEVLIKHYRREAAVRQCLFGNGTRYKEPVTVEKIAEASRINVFPEDPKCYPLCGSRTNSAATIELDAEYPELLSCIYGVFGPPRYSAYLPVPLLLDRSKIPAELAKVTFCAAVFARWEKQFDLLPQDKLAAFEAGLNKRHAEAVEAARKKLKAGGTRADAAKILTDAFLQNWEALWKLSQERDAEMKKNPPPAPKAPEPAAKPAEPAAKKAPEAAVKSGECTAPKAVAPAPKTAD